MSGIFLFTAPCVKASLLGLDACVRVLCLFPDERARVLSLDWEQAAEAYGNAIKLCPSKNAAGAPYYANRAACHLKVILVSGQSQYRYFFSRALIRIMHARTGRSLAHTRLRHRPAGGKVCLLH
jgi:hypothetical protein